MLNEYFFETNSFNLDATLDSGQAFRWVAHQDSWSGIIHGRWVRLSSKTCGILAETTSPVTSWNWLADYLQLELDIESVLKSFPRDQHMEKAIHTCHGLRLLRQDPWETLASFILSSTKQIVQIRQIISILSERHGEPLKVPEGFAPAYDFPKPGTLAILSEKELRECKMGFRAPYLLEAARCVDSGALDLESIRALSLSEARLKLTSLHGVGNKIADCVLLFAYGFPEAFPVDVWIARALRELYFPKRKPTTKRLQNFISSYFGPNSGYAQQYLFHYMRNRETNLK